MVVVGADVHKRTHTFIAVDQAGQQLGQVTASADSKGHDKAIRWATERFGEDLTWGIEDCRHLSARLEADLLDAGQEVVRVPAKLMAEQRRTARPRGKSDPIDALAVDHREDLVRQRTAVVNRFRWHLHRIDPTLDPRANALEKEITALVTDQAPALLELPGCGPLTAAKIVGETAGITRFPTEAKYAMHAGVAPIPVWPGRTAGRVRLNKAGNRQFNPALHRIAITQIRLPGLGQAYYDKRLAAGDTTTEALRCLKRRLAPIVYTTLKNADQAATATPLAAAA